MTIRTRLRIMTAASSALIVVMALLLYWSRERIAIATKAGDMASEIVFSSFERALLRGDYLRNGYRQRSREQWFAKQAQVSDLIRKAYPVFISDNSREILSGMLHDNEECAVIFRQVVANRESLSKGERPPDQASQIENRLVGLLLLKTSKAIGDTRRLQEESRKLIASTQKTALLMGLFKIVSLALFVIMVACSIGRLISKGIANLQQGAAAVSRGDFRHAIPLEGGGEFAEVAEGFNTMTRKLAASHASLEYEIEAGLRTASQIVQLNLELTQTVSQLQGANQELEAFAYSVSHDLRAPLRAIGGFSQALLEDFGDRLEAEARDYLNEIVTGAGHMAQLIDGLLTLSRCTRGELRRDQVDLSTLAQRIRCELERLEPGRRVHWLVAPGLSAQGDERMIEVVLRNLLGNAWKYTCHAAQPTIRVYSELEEGERLFRVADNGAGFDMAHAAKLFQPFQRLHRQDEFPGMGIGLATAQRIVHRHGGTIKATGAPGAGATFSFTLPCGEQGKGAIDEQGKVDTAG